MSDRSQIAGVSRETIRADFDRIARLPAEGWDHNSHYHNFLLRHVPERVGEALEIGCGTGSFTRRLADRAARVRAIDLSPQMIGVARELSLGYDNVSWEVADATVADLPTEHFDCIASIATLHHMPLKDVLSRFERALKPAGILLVLDLYRATRFVDIGCSLPAFPVSLLLRMLHGGRLRPSHQSREAWQAHACHDVFLALPEIRAICESVLPAASVRRHLLWRYSLIWRKRG